MNEETTQYIYVPTITSGTRNPLDTYIHDSYTSEVSACKGLIQYLFDMDLLTFEDYCDYKTNSKYAKKDRLNDFSKQIYDSIDIGCDCKDGGCNCWEHQISDYINTAKDFNNICIAFGNGYTYNWTYKIHTSLLM
jgi:hypothetical protein